MLYFPIGNLAKTPYFIKSLGIRVYCYEEIAYVITENAAAAVCAEIGYGL